MNEYIGESSRMFGERFKEHLKTPSPIYDHQSNSGHITAIGELQNYRQRVIAWLGPSKKPCILG